MSAKRSSTISSPTSGAVIDGDGPTPVKTESADPLDISQRNHQVIEVISPTLSMLNDELRERRFAGNGIVEQDREQHALQRHMNLKNELAVVKGVISEEKRRRKGKQPVCYSEQNAMNAAGYRTKKEAFEEEQSPKPAKRHKELHKDAKSNPLLDEPDDKKVAVSNSANPVSEGSHSGETTPNKKPVLRKYVKAKIVEEPRATFALSNHRYDRTLYAPRGRRLNVQTRWRQHSQPAKRKATPGLGLQLGDSSDKQSLGPKRAELQRREVDIAIPRPECKCVGLPACFRHPELLDPSFASFPGHKQDLMAAINKLANVQAILNV